MKRAVVLGFLGVFLAAAGRPAESAFKVGVVDFQKALNDVEQGKKAKAQLKTDFEAKQKKLDLQQDDLKRLREELEKQRLVLSDSDFRSKEEAFNKKYMELQKNFADYSQGIREKEARYTAQILKNMKEVCDEVGKKEGYSLIVESSQGAVLFAVGREDLTDRVVKIYNERFKGPLTLLD